MAFIQEQELNVFDPGSTLLVLCIRTIVVSNYFVFVCLKVAIRPPQKNDEVSDVTLFCQS